MIEFKNYQLGQCSAFFSFSLDEEKKNLVLFWKKDNCIDAFCKELSGINKVDNVYFNNQLLFDNKNYFDNRIYLDSSKRYFKTLDELVIQDQILTHYGKALDSEKLKKYIHDLGVYSYFKNKKLSREGNDLFCISLALSILQNIIVKLDHNQVLKEKSVLELMKNNSSFGLTVITKASDEIFNRDIIGAFDNLLVFNGDNFSKIDIKNSKVYCLYPKEKINNDQLIKTGVIYKLNKMYLISELDNNLKDLYSQYFKIRELSFLEAIDYCLKEDK